MAFGHQQQPAGGNFKDILKINAVQGRIYKVDYDQASRTKIDTDISTPPPRMAFDFGVIESGWGHFTTGGPQFRTVPYIEGRPLPAQPADVDEKGRKLFRPVVRVVVKLSQTLGGSLREIASSAGVVLEAFGDLHERFKEARRKRPPASCPSSSCRGSSRSLRAARRSCSR